jgi:8-oxo-dGTP diphosphatase
VFDVVVVYVMAKAGDERSVLLGKKLRGLGHGRVVGPGGKVTPGETHLDAAIREVFEEVGIELRAEDMTHRAVITYPFRDRPDYSQRSFVYTAEKWRGEPVSSDELEPQWYRLTDIPWDQMWADAKLWLPRVFDGHFVEGTLTIGLVDEVIDQQWSRF